MSSGTNITETYTTKLRHFAGSNYNVNIMYTAQDLTGFYNTVPSWRCYNLYNEAEHRAVNHT